MLVLSRRIGEEIVLPNANITIRVVKIGGRQVRLGIDAPQEINIHRTETWNRICENQDAADRVEVAQREQDADAAPERELEQWIHKRTGGRIHSLLVAHSEGMVVVGGRTDSYHALQLAHAAIREAVAASVICDGAQVSVNIEVNRKTG